MRNETKKMLRWHRKYHKPLSKKYLTLIGDRLETMGKKGVWDLTPSDGFSLWNISLELLLEVRRLRNK